MVEVEAGSRSARIRPEPAPDPAIGCSQLSEAFRPRYLFCSTNRLSSFVSWLVKPIVDILVNSSSCVGSSVITIRTLSPDGKNSTVERAAHARFQVWTSTRKPSGPHHDSKPVLVVHSFQ